MDHRAAFLADVETAVAVEPGQRALDDPPRLAEPAAVRRLAPRQEGHDAAGRSWSRWRWES